MTRLPLLGTKIRVAGFGGLRLGEQNALRAIDVFFEHGYVHVNGAWITPRGAAGFRGPVKNHSLHEVPLPRSLMHDELLPRVAVLDWFNHRRLYEYCGDIPPADLETDYYARQHRAQQNAELSHQ